MLVSLKDRIPRSQWAGVVYRIPCGNCEKVYIGQTGRTLDHRLKEHRRALTSGNLAQSALAEHAADRGHAIDWGSAEVVDTHQQFHQRCLLESWHIRAQDTTLNREEGNLPPVYNQLIPRARPQNTSSGSTDRAYRLDTPSPFSFPVNHFFSSFFQCMLLKLFNGLLSGRHG